MLRQPHLPQLPIRALCIWGHGESATEWKLSGQWHWHFGSGRNLGPQAASGEVMVVEEVGMAAAIVFFPTLTLFGHSTIKWPAVTACNITHWSSVQLKISFNHTTIHLWKPCLLWRGMISCRIWLCGWLPLCTPLRCWDLRSVGWTGAAVCMARIREPAHILHGRM